jgi:hypothetical protein
MNLELIKGYLRLLMMGRGMSAPDPMADLSKFDADLAEMRRRAEAEGNLEWLRLSIDALAARPEGRVQRFVGVFPLRDAEVVTLLRHAHARLWPDQAMSAPGTEAPLEFVTMSDAEWDRLRNPDVGFADPEAE